MVGMNVRTERNVFNYLNSQYEGDNNEMFIRIFYSFLNRTINTIIDHI